MENLKINVQLTEKDHLNYQVDHFSFFKSKRGFVSGGILLCIFAYFYLPYILMNGFQGLNISTLFPILVWPFGYLLIYLLMIYRTKVSFKTDSFANQSHDILVNEEGISMISEKYNLHPLWKDIYRYKTTKKAVYIYIAELKAIIIPNRFLNAEEDRDYLLNLLKTKTDNSRFVKQTKKRNAIRVALFSAIMIFIIYSVYNDYIKNRVVETAYQLRESNNFAGAKKLYTEFINSNPDDDDAYLERANCEISLSEFALAIADCEKAIEINPKNGKAYYYYAYALRNIEKKDQACEAIKKSVELGYTGTTEKICD